MRAPHVCSLGLHRVVEQLKAVGLAGVVAYGLLNTLYYTTAFGLAWVFIAAVPRGEGGGEWRQVWGEGGREAGGGGGEGGGRQGGEVGRGGRHAPSGICMPPSGISVPPCPCPCPPQAWA